MVERDCNPHRSVTLPPMEGLELWRELGQQLRVDSVRCAAAAKSGHPSSGMSAADLMAVLLAKYLCYDFDKPKDPANDRLVFSKGHASTLLYSMYRAAGAISEEKLLTYRQFSSIFEGHPTPRIPWVDVATGSLGQGLPYGVGMALAGKPGWHGKALDDPEEAIAELGGVRNITVQVAKPETSGRALEIEHGELELPRYELGDEVATRKAYGEALAALGKARGDVVAMDGEVSNSTFAEIFKDAVPERYFEMFIAEQQMVATAVGMQVTGWRPFASTFAAFISRAYDFVRMSAISRANYSLSGSHAGVSIGEDGPSQMGLEDIAALRAVHGSTVLHPCDANQTAKLVPEMADREGIVYLRTLRPNTPVIYDADDEFEIGGSRTLRDGEDVTLVAAGITVHEALKAANALAEEGIEARVIDLYSIKPLDEETIHSLATPIVTVEDHLAEGGLGEAVLSALAQSEERPRVVRLAVREMPHSGKPAELLAAAGIDAEHIADAARQLVGAPVSA